MLYVKTGKFTKDCITQVSEFFDLFKKKEWFEDEFVRKVIKGIDKSEVIKGEYIESPVFGGMPPQYLSSGSKALILMKMQPDLVVYATRCGNNCAPYLIELATERDVTVMLHHPFRFPDVFPDGFVIKLVESGKEVHSDEEFVEEFYRCRHGEYNKGE